MIDKYSESKLLNILTNFLGTYEYSYNNNFKFFCPSCKHRKRKLEISFEEGNYHCWVCNLRGRNLLNLVRKYGSEQDFHNFAKAYKPTNFHENYKKPDNEDAKPELPAEFLSLTKKQSQVTDIAINYLKSRKIDVYSIIKYNLGFCLTGDYENRIIIPSYDKNHKLNYFTSRSIYNYNVPKYKNINSSVVTPKNVIMFEEFVNYSDPVFLVEGPIDAIKGWYNAIPLLGSQLNTDTYLFQELVRHQPTIVFALDNDGVGKQKMVKVAETLLSYELDELYYFKYPAQDFGSMEIKDIIKLKQDKTNYQKINEQFLIQFRLKEFCNAR